MSLPSTPNSAAYALFQIVETVQSVKNAAPVDLASLQAAAVDAAWMTAFLDRWRFARDNLAAQAAVAGIDALGPQVFAGYGGTLSSDVNAAIGACIFWAQTNVSPLNFAINADGSRTAASWTSAQTAGLQSALQAVIASIN